MSFSEISGVPTLGFHTWVLTADLACVAIAFCFCFKIIFKHNLFKVQNFIVFQAVIYSLC